MFISTSASHFVYCFISSVFREEKKVNIEKSNGPMIPDVVLDDVVIHFRCENTMGVEGRTDYGMIKFTD